MGDKLAIPELNELARFTNMVSLTDFVPAALKGQKAAIGVAMIYGHELGLSPMQSLQSIAVINGKPAVYGDGLMALCLAHPECESIDEAFDAENMTATCVVKRKGHAPYTFTFSQGDAEKAGLWGKKGPWQEYPKRMLQMRARGFALRDKFADALKGIITAEEARDYPETAVVAAVPEPEPAPEPKPAQLTADVAVDENVSVSHSQTAESADDSWAWNKPAELSDSNKALPGNDGTATFKFGKHRGSLLSDSDVPDSYLQWYRNATGKSANDPMKRKYRDDNLAHLREIDAAIVARETTSDARREHVQQDLPDDDMPF